VLTNPSLSVRQEWLTPETCIEFLSRSDLGERYPQEDFCSRIEVLLRERRGCAVRR
jgi:hypothetical protein